MVNREKDGYVGVPVSEDAATPTGHAAAPNKRPLTLLPLIALIFFEVSGGPFGTEVRTVICWNVHETVHQGGKRLYVNSTHCFAVEQPQLF